VGLGFCASLCVSSFATLPQVAPFFQASVGLPDVKVDNVLEVGPLDADGKRLSWMEYESYKSASLRRRLPALDTSEDSELELTTLSAIKVDSTLTTSLWPLHDRDPFFVIGEKPMV